MRAARVRRALRRDRGGRAKGHFRCTDIGTIMSGRISTWPFKQRNGTTANGANRRTLKPTGHTTYAQRSAQHGCSTAEFRS
jgi:hypothetical protein